MYIYMCVCLCVCVCVHIYKYMHVCRTMQSKIYARVSLYTHIYVIRKCI